MAIVSYRYYQPADLVHLMQFSLADKAVCAASSDSKRKVQLPVIITELITAV